MTATTQELAITAAGASMLMADAMQHAGMHAAALEFRATANRILAHSDDVRTLTRTESYDAFGFLARAAKTLRDGATEHTPNPAA